jgi:23S rRNA pseudouridine1911/1915/1917 synthase
LDCQILLEDNHLLAVNKPAGILVQGDRTGDRPLVEFLKDYLAKKYNKPGKVFLGVVHRLDRPVSGVLLFARTSKALERLNALFAARDIRKTYLAVVAGRPPAESGRLEHWLKKDNVTNVVRASRKESSGSQKAELDYRLLGSIGQHSLLEVQPHTGRPHQIRVQLASMGCPIAGDLKYGYPRADAGGNIALHAFRLEFRHPVKDEVIELSAPLPASAIWQPYRDLVRSLFPENPAEAL